MVHTTRTSQTRLFIDNESMCHFSLGQAQKEKRESHKDPGPQGDSDCKLASSNSHLKERVAGRGVNPASAWAWRESGRRHKSKLCPPSRAPWERSPISDASRATAELVRELPRIKIPLLPPVRFSKPTAQKPRPDNCQGGAAGRT